MLKQQIRTAKIADPGGHFSQAIGVPSKGVMVFVSGMTARRPDGKIAGIGDRERVNKVRRQYFRSPEFLVEISAIAVIPA